MGYFQKGTPILMSDNSYKAVEDIGIGDYIKGLEIPEEVINTLYAQSLELYIVQFSNNTKIGITSDQVLSVPYGGECAEKLLKGDSVLAFDESNELYPLQISNITKTKNFNKTVYNIVLKENHIVIANNILSRDFI